MYVWADDMVGEYLELMDENTSLMVISDHGFKLGELHDDPTITNSMRRVSDDFHDLDGIIYLAGRGVRTGVRIPTVRQLDITPTILELLGLPAADNMPGRVLTDALTVDEPRPRVASYETTSTGNRPDAGDDAVDREVIAHLEALGYLDGDDEDHDPVTPTRSHADMLLRAGRYEEAAAAFEKLAEEEPENAMVQLNLAVALSNQRRLDEALVILERVEELDPTNPLLYFNRGAIYEWQGNEKAAVEEYRRTLQVDANHERAKLALERLTGSARVYVPANEEQRRAMELAVQAAELSRRGDYEQAIELLDEAAALAPDLAMVHQYRSNVSYLAGDLDGAIAALERVLELEPENAVARKNLEAARKKRDSSPQ
jgi:Flp pilus assembly protein TadD